MIPSANNTPTDKELELINSYARNPLSAEDVYCFSLTLCDNEVDRDFERFSINALKQLSQLFVGKTGISDHSMSAENQKARIFSTWLEEDSSKKTSIGETYVALKAKAYMLITDANRDMIEQIEGGIKKEVSVGCSMGSMTCSICSKDMKKHECSHIKGKRYGKKLCHGILDNAADAYEWSFVAVPAQKNAGVTKTFLQKNKTAVSFPAHNPHSDGEPTGVYSRKYVEGLEKRADDGILYREYLTAEIKKYALISMHKVNADAFISGCESMDTKSLIALRDSLKAQASEIIPISLQLNTVTHRQVPSNNNSFKI